MLHQLYSALGTGVYLLLAFLCPLIEAAGARFGRGYGFAQRLGRYPRQVGADRSGCSTIWVHASSVGEVQAAILLVNGLLGAGSGYTIVVTSTTEQGNRLARSRMPAAVSCLMAPLDLPQAVRAALRTLRPDCYVCLETELWPVMLTQARRANIPMLLLNGRLSQRSLDRYKRIQGYMASLLAGFRTVAVISEADGDRYRALGVPTARVQVCGNLKYDMPAQSPDLVREVSRRRLGVSSARIFLCGSTHEGEEAQLLSVFRILAERAPTVWVIAPRHLERLPALEALLMHAGVAFERLSALAENDRHAQVVVVDSMGDLADLYAGGDYIFCGGSLVDKGGHNILEAARWGRPVYFGPHMKDFRDAAEMLVQAGGGFQVADADALAGCILSHADNLDQYAIACMRAAEVAARQRGAVARQVEVVRQALATC